MAVKKIIKKTTTRKVTKPVKKTEPYIAEKGKVREGPPGLSIKKIWKETPAYVRAKAKQRVILKKYNGNAKTKAGFPAVTAVAVDLEESRTPHKCSIVGKDKNNDYISTQKAVLMDCTCDYWLYYCEYAMWYNGSAIIKRSNGKPALVKNPHNQVMCCKHLAKLILTVAEQGD